MTAVRSTEVTTVSKTTPPDNAAAARMTTVPPAAITTWRQRSPIGDLEIEAGPGGLRRLQLTGRTEKKRTAIGPAGDIVAAIEAWFAGDLSAVDGLAVDLEGRPSFSRAVLEALRTIRPGDTTTYGELAAMAGRPGAARAVGQAVGGNPVPIVVPCHRVVAANGTLGGFSSGLDLKRWLLRHEGGPALTGGWEPRRVRKPVPGR